MKRISKPFLYLLLSLALFIPLFSGFDSAPQPAFSAPLQAQIDLTPMAPVGPQTRQNMDETKNQVFFFYAKSCSHCQAIYNDILKPFMGFNNEKVQLWILAVDNPTNYEALIQIEADYGIQPNDRGLPTILIGNQLLIGEEQCLAELTGVLGNLLDQTEIVIPKITDFDLKNLDHEPASFVEDIEMCTVENPEFCESGNPIYGAYFYQVGCKECSRVESDLIYLQSKYPNFIIEEFNIYDEAAMGEWLAENAGRADDFHSPSLFINNHAWIGDEEITPQAIDEALAAYSESGSPRYWTDYDPEMDRNALVERFESMGWLTVVVAGLIDGLNPCAFATLIFFISYLTISGRKGKEIIFVGISFTLGVFIAYLVIGMGFYKVLDLLGNLLKVLGQWVIGLTGVLCLVLAFFALKDYLTARKGDIGDMALNLPHALRMRINKVIRQGKSNRTYIGGAFVTGIVISFLELACTGQIYLPTIIFVSSIPELKVRAFTYLIIYNLLFITPLIVVFVLAYFGTTSKDLTVFLQKNAAKVKLGMVFLFFALGIWMILSIL